MCKRMTMKWAAAGLVAAALGLSPAGAARASSHREAPLIAEDPAADATDLYAFRSPTNETNVTVSGALNIIANYWPLEEPGGGPNWPRFSDGVLYEIKIDNDGDAIEDITYQFRFRTEYLNSGSFLLAAGPISSTSDAKLQVRQRYTVTRIDKGGAQTVLLQDQLTPPVYAGNFTMGDETVYEALARTAIYPLGGDASNNGQVFAGQRDDPFFVDLGAVFDLVRIRCSTANDANSAAGCAGQAGKVKGVDTVGGYNVHSLALQIPIAKLLKSSATPGKDQVLGIWTTASRQRVTIRRAPPLTAATKVKTQDTAGPWVQVSRLGLPLINEVIVPLALKDYYNSLPPSQDAAVFSSPQGAPLLTDPELAKAMKALYNISTPAAGRTDILEIVQFGIRTSATGSYIAPFVGPTYANFAPADILRVDVSVPPPADLSTNPLGAASQLGTVTDTNLGFPNGRRLHDDVVDIMEKVVGGALRSTDTSALTDGVSKNDYPGGFQTSFPFLNTPWSGSRVNTNVAPFPYLHTAQ